MKQRAITSYATLNRRCERSTAKNDNVDNNVDDKYHNKQHRKNIIQLLTYAAVTFCVVLTIIASKGSSSLIINKKNNDGNYNLYSQYLRSTEGGGVSAADDIIDDTNEVEGEEYSADLDAPPTVFRGRLSSKEEEGRSNDTVVEKAKAREEKTAAEAEENEGIRMEKETAEAKAKEERVRVNFTVRAY